MRQTIELEIDCPFPVERKAEMRPFKNGEVYVMGGAVILATFDSEGSYIVLTKAEPDAVKLARAVQRNDRVPDEAYTLADRIISDFEGKAK